MTEKKINQNIMKICMDAGMSEVEFFNQIRFAYASYVAAQLDENPQAIVVMHTAVFPDCNIIIESRKEKSHNQVTLN